MRVLLSTIWTNLQDSVSKQDIRGQIWDYMEAQNLADFPRPVHHRIPNFKGASRAAEHFPRLQAFKMARTVKVNPDAPQKNARFFVLNSKKTLLVPTPRLRTGLFNKITPPPGATKDILRKCATSQGVRNYSTPVGLDSRVLVDLVVVGSVAVSEKGWRIGKGEGYADLEYAMMVSMGAVSQGTPVVTVVHDCQVVDIPETLLEEHDLTVDYILTPTRVIATGCERPKPTGIVWSKISCEMMGRMPVLRSLRCREERAGKDVTLRDTRRPLPSLESGSVQGEDVPSCTVYVGNLPRDARVSELKRALSARGAAPSRLTWQGPQRRAFLHYREPAEAWQAISRLQGFCLGANTAKVALARQQGASGPAGGRAGEPHPDP
ncbi:methenyltetrahydrofolate synthase domain-containing protein isoform X1 [Physeter macrocephalus]|uniref:Methenyltetrahydrofolate synthase domain-containing protein n=2 Tax=Physeter macrocephalus TaxID=9755 RepID=A0A455ABK8_PHYMC|nr:methenyltetrahydrofolate synthase domain-containing protein isoform X1 [Physeter catodon]|eukprot:XP_028333495.1 methenyltetrahydrofolate synthase domain-containing protein isoform X1 [Physeter catodon]